MSTRSTYEIDGQWIYVHCDGYPSGAADKFDLMLEAEKERTSCNGGLKDSFIRGNPNAELEDEGHHGDTEYHYVINDGKLIALEIDNWHERTWKEFYSGSIEDFIGEYQEV